jgi:hypothetical protein
MEDIGMASPLSHKYLQKRIFAAPPQGLCCYICNHPIKNMHSDHTTIICTDPEVIARHNGCAPGSAKWLNSEYGAKSNIRQYYISDGEESVIMGDVPVKVKKQFPKKNAALTSEQRQLVGRVKYMAYMDTQCRDGAKIDWMMVGTTEGIVIIRSSETISIYETNDPKDLNLKIQETTPQEAASWLEGYFQSLADEKAGIETVIPVASSGGKEVDMTKKKVPASAPTKKPAKSTPKAKSPKKPMRTLEDLANESHYVPSEEGEAD